MDESQDSAAFTAECVTVDPSRAEYVQQVLSAARETLARSCGEEFQFRGRPADVPGAPERSRDRPLAARDRISSSPLNTQTPTWAEDRAAVLEAIRTWEQERAPILEAIRGLRRELCEALSDQLAELRWQQLGTSFDTSRSAYHALKQWCDAERSWIEEESLAKGGATAGDDRKMNNEPLEREPRTMNPLNASQSTVCGLARKRYSRQTPLRDVRRGFRPVALVALAVRRGAGAEAGSGPGASQHQLPTANPHPEQH